MTGRLVAAVTELVEALAEVARQEAAAVPAAPDRLLSIDEAGALLGLGRTTVYGEVQAARLRSVKVGRRRLVPSTSVADYIASRAS